MRSNEDEAVHGHWRFSGPHSCETGTFPEVIDDSVARNILRTKRGLVLKASAIAPENTRDMRGKGPAGGSVRLKRPKRSKYLPRCPSDFQRAEKSALKAIKAIKAIKVQFLRSSLLLFPRSRRLCSNISIGEYPTFRLEPSSARDKRDDMSA